MNKKKYVKPKFLPKDGEYAASFLLDFFWAADFNYMLTELKFHELSLSGLVTHVALTADSFVWLAK